MQTKGTKFEETAIIIRQEEIADDIYSMWLRTEHIAAHAKAGQFEIGRASCRERV